MLVDGYEVQLSSGAINAEKWLTGGEMNDDWVVLFGRQETKYYSYDCGWGKTVSKAVVNAAKIAKGRCEHSKDAAM